MFDPPSVHGSPSASSSAPAGQASTLELAIALRDQLAHAQLRLVLVESCTAGRVAACLGLLPGISQWLCGSLVVYRSGSKAAWLGVPDSLLSDPLRGPVSPAASHWLANAAIERTPEADLSVAITGDVGPGAPPETDGWIFLAAAFRRAAPPPESAGPAAPCGALAQPIIELGQQLSACAPQNISDIPARQARLEEAAQRTLKFALEATSQLGRSGGQS